MKKLMMLSFWGANYCLAGFVLPLRTPLMY
jgi:hypothetical protein